MPEKINLVYSELKRRKVIRVGMYYAIGGWFLLQIGEVTFDPLEMPTWAMRLLIYLVVAGFPLALTLAWFFDLTRQGVKRDPFDVKVRDGEENSFAPIRVHDDTPSIAVLPFTDMSEEQDHGYFCEGVAEAILTALTRVKNLQVASRTSSFRFKNSSADIRDIGRQLSVRTVLEGSVRKSKDRLRVTAQLINVEDGYHLWSKQFDADPRDIFEIQDEIANSIAEAGALGQSEKEQGMIKTAPTKDVRAYEYYLRGRQFFHRLRGNDMLYARQMFGQAIEIDPEFVLAWAGRADCYAFVEMYVKPDDQNRIEATRSSERALELDSTCAEPHASRGLAYLVNEQYDEAIEEFETAVRLNPNLFEPLYYYARASFHQGKLQKAADLFARASEVNSEDYQSRILRAHVLAGLGQVDLSNEVARKAITVIEKHLKWNPDDARAFYLGAGSLQQIGERDRAERWIGSALAIDPTDSVVLYNVACFYALNEQGNKALNYLESAIDQGTVSGSWMEHDNDLASLREEPRFQTLLQQLQQ